MSPLLVPGAVLAVDASISVSGHMAAIPPLISARCRRDIPAGLPKIVLSSGAVDERPVTAVPIPLTLCALVPGLLAINCQDPVATAMAMVVLNQACVIITLFTTCFDGGTILA